VAERILHRDLGQVAQENEIMSATHPDRRFAAIVNTTTRHVPTRRGSTCVSGLHAAIVHDMF